MACVLTCLLHINSDYHSDILERGTTSEAVPRELKLSSSGRFEHFPNQNHSICHTIEITQLQNL